MKLQRKVLYALDRLPSSKLVWFCILALALALGLSVCTLAHAESYTFDGGKEGFVTLLDEPCTDLSVVELLPEGMAAQMKAGTWIFNDERIKLCWMIPPTEPTIVFGVTNEPAQFYILRSALKAGSL